VLAIIIALHFIIVTLLPLYYIFAMAFFMASSNKIDYVNKALFLMDVFRQKNTIKTKIEEDALVWYLRNIY